MPAQEGREAGTSPRRRARRRSGAGPAGMDEEGDIVGGARLTSPKRSARLAAKYGSQQQKPSATAAVKTVVAVALPAAAAVDKSPAASAAAAVATAVNTAAAPQPQPQPQPAPPTSSAVAAAELIHIPRRQRRSWSLRSQSAIKLAWEHSWLGYDEIPEWMRDNSLILGQYRPQMTFQQALRSLWSLHNESYNTWSHIIGGLVMIGLMVSLYCSDLEPQGLLGAQAGEPPTPPPKWPLYLSLVSILYGYCASAAAHLFHVVNKRVHDLLWSLDHAAIAISCACSFTPFCVYAFACREGTAALYISVTAVLAAAVIAMSNLKVFHLPNYRPLRAAAQLSLAVWAQLPLLHAGYLLHPHPAAFACIVKVYRAIAVMVLGVGIYAGRLTESLLPGRVDLIGSGHNIMHTLAIPAHIMFTGAGQELWAWRGSSEGVCAAAAGPA